jgi:hypothetical protein
VLSSFWSRFRGRAKLYLLPTIAVGLALSLPLLGWVAQLAAQGMALPGKLDVTPTGAASYTVPIAVPPGTGGMVPSLSIAYNSQARNGLLGVGWHLEGLPSVSRCPRTLAQDGVRGSVNYDADDRFCLDGQRLVAISGSYGADGTEYRTEIESFSKVISRGTAGIGPAWFEVWTKSGQRMEFGNTADSRVLAQGKTTARDWVVNKVSDTPGNYFTVTYVNDTTNGQVYPSRIDYTGNAGAGLTPYNSVRFVYDTTRPDVVAGYHLGSLQKTTVRLAKVQTYAGSALVADYQLAYEQSPITNRSRLTSVALCTGGGACLPATTFGWTKGTLTPTVMTNVANADGQLAGYRPYFGDFNGDGRTDIMWDKGSSATRLGSAGTRVLWTATGSASFTVASNFAGQDGTLADYAPLVADFNRDGRSDVWWYFSRRTFEPPGPTMQWFSMSDGTFKTTAGPDHLPRLLDHCLDDQCVYINYSPITLSDFNGDGRADIVWGVRQEWPVISITKADGTVSSKSLNGCDQWPGWANCILSLNVVDYNGDGLSDILWLDENNDGGRRWALMRGNGDGTFTQVGKSEASESYNRWSPPQLDINGDGKTDIFWDNTDNYGRSKGQRILWMSKGDGTFIEQTNVGGQDGTLTEHRPHAGDFNGDGLIDILWVKTDTTGLSTGPVTLWLNKGDGTFTVVDAFGGPGGAPVSYVPDIADFNGDGKADILWDKRSANDPRSQGQRVLWLSDRVAADLMTTVTSGVGATASLTYKMMTDSAVYSKDSTAVEPLVDLQGPIAVVSRVDSGNGIGGTLATGYTYAGAKVDVNGRGFLGFRKMTITDLQTEIMQTTNYRQDFPFTGLVASEIKKAGAVTLSATVHSYTAVPQGGARFQALLAQSQATGADLDGTALPTVTSTYKYDSYGNATEIAVTTLDGFSKTTTNTYTNDTAKWLFGRLTRATVKSTSP